MLGVFPGWGGGEAHLLAGLRASFRGLPGSPAAEPGLEEDEDEEEEWYVSLALESPIGVEGSLPFLSSAAEAGLASLGVGECCDMGVSFTRWQISA